MVLGIMALLILSYLLFKHLKRMYQKRTVASKENPISTGHISFVGNTFATTQQDQRHVEMIKRIDQTFKEQKQDMQIRSTKAHGADCIGILACKKRKCFVLEPDKIMSKMIVKRKTNAQRAQELNSQDIG